MYSSLTTGLGMFKSQHLYRPTQQRDSMLDRKSLILNKDPQPINQLSLCPSELPPAATGYRVIQTSRQNVGKWRRKPCGRFGTSIYCTSIFVIFISSKGLSTLFALTFSIAWITSKPENALPNIVCFLSNHGVVVVVMKN